jgi:hypothetical protein
MLYVITVALEDPARNGAAVERWIEQNFESWTRPMSGVWFVDSYINCDQILNGMKPLLDARDRAVIAKTAMTDVIWHGVSDTNALWLAEQFPGSYSERIPGKEEGLIDQD